jgi:hypothetical protein
MTSNSRKPSITLIKVTPEMAEEWLGKNTHNRNIRRIAVDSYARDMAAGNWRLTGEPIKFTPDGVLLDGQHRLLAVIKGGVPVELFVAKGIAPDSQRVMDTGAKRTSSDMLKLDGYANPVHLAAAARYAMTYQSGTDSRNQTVTPTHSEIGAFVSANEELVSAVAAVTYYRRTIDLPISVTAVAWWLLVQVDAEACENFFSSIATSATSGAGDPRSALIQRLATARRKGERLQQPAQLSMLLRAWNAWRKGSQLASLQVYSTGGGLVPIPTKLI